MSLWKKYREALWFILLFLFFLPTSHPQRFGPQLPSGGTLGDIEGPQFPDDLSRECLCPHRYAPFCTTGNHTFTNECFAQCAKEEVWVTCSCQEVSDGTCPRSFKIENLPDKLELQEKLGDVIAIVTENELQTLQSGRVVTEEGVTDYQQRLLLKNVLRDIPGGRVIYDLNEMDILDFYLFLKKLDDIYEYEITFLPGLKSKIIDNKLPDIHGKNITLLGKNYIFTDSDINPAFNTLELELTNAGGDSITFFDTSYQDIEFTSPVLYNGKSLQ
ncbi:hypothetical protein HYS48_00980, partial [Candidatus Woesearchaeota archaeon]|nr:hypothetical protein [Candidatus Woesearchaeota archaeon]